MGFLLLFILVLNLKNRLNRLSPIFVIESFLFLSFKSHMNGNNANLEDRYN